MTKLRDKPAATQIGTMAIGDEKTITDEKSGRTWTLKRTARDYCFDLATAYNKALTYDLEKRGFIWAVMKQRGEFILKPEVMSEANRNLAVKMMDEGQAIYLDPEGNVKAVYESAW